MYLQRGENNRDCILASAAMVMDEPLADLKKRIGHDGGKKVFDAPEPYCYNGFHIQEIIDQAFLYNWSVMNIQAHPATGQVNGPGVYPLPINDNRINVYMKRFPGIVAGVLGGHTHAVAWDRKNIFDPSGFVYKLKEYKFQIHEFWAFSRYV